MSLLSRKTQRRLEAKKLISQITVTPLSIPEPVSGPSIPLDAYLTSIGLSHHESAIRASIAQGAHDIHTILTSPLSPSEIHRLSRNIVSTNPHARIPIVTNITWYLFWLAIQRNQPFVTGAFLLLDPSTRLSSFFCGIGTPRRSSHLKRYTTAQNTGGIDLFFSSDSAKSDLNKKGIVPLPHSHQHILYTALPASSFSSSFSSSSTRTGAGTGIGKGKEKRRYTDRPPSLFLKPEKNGIKGVRNLARHSAGYLSSLKRRYTLGANEVVGMQKERIPTGLVSKFTNLIEVAGLEKKEEKEIIKEVGSAAEGEGVAAMWAFLAHKLGVTSTPITDTTTTTTIRDTTDTTTTDTTTTDTATTDMITANTCADQLEEEDEEEERDTEEITGEERVLPEKARKRMQEFLDYLEREYDFAQYRFGNEVVIDLEAVMAGPLPVGDGVSGPSTVLSALRG